MTKFLVYVGLLLVGLVSFLSHEWGASIHSVIGIGIGGLVAVHLIAQRKWIRAVRRRPSEHPERRLAAYNVVFAVVLAACLVTGFPIWFGFEGAGVEQVHDITAIAFVLMIFGHLVLNHRRIRAFTMRAVGMRRTAP